MNLHPCFFLYLPYSIRAIKYRESRCIIYSLKVKCSFNYRSFFIFSLYPHDFLFIFQHSKFIFKVFIYIGK